MPINEVIQQIIIQLKKCFRVEKAKLNNLSLATSVISIFAAYIVPFLVFGYSSQEKVRLQVDIDQGSQLISDWLESSLHYFRWLIILIGSVFTPSNRFNTAAAETIGIIATISFVLYVIKFTKSLEFIKRTLGESNCSIAGGIYILGILLTRGDSVYPLLWATSPRYVTRTIIFCLGLVSAALDSQKSLVQKLTNIK